MKTIWLFITCVPQLLKLLDLIEAKVEQSRIAGNIDARTKDELPKLHASMAAGDIDGFNHAWNGLPAPGPNKVP